jgi:hypothetical protein
MSRLLTVALFTAPTIAMACGSGEGSKVDSAKAEAVVKARLVEYGTGAHIVSNRCPRDVARRKGKHFECFVKYRDGSNNPVELEVTNDKGDLRVFEIHAPK